MIRWFLFLPYLELYMDEKNNTTLGKFLIKRSMYCLFNKRSFFLSRSTQITALAHKDKSKVSPMIDQVFYKPRPGTLIFFPGYVPHEFAVDMGVEPFRFIHFNLQAVRNIIVESAKGMNNVKN